MTLPFATQVELTTLRRKLAARKDKAGFAANCAAIQARIDKLEARMEPLDTPPEAA